MPFAVLPFNAGPNTRTSLARQLAGFAAEVVRGATGEEINMIAYLAQVSENPPQIAFVNPSDSVNEPGLIRQLLASSPMTRAMDGLATQQSDGSLDIVARFFDEGADKPRRIEEIHVGPNELFAALRTISLALLSEVRPGAAELPPNEEIFGTTNEEAFLLFLDGHDAAQYVERSGGAVTSDFSPETAIQQLERALQLDPDWEAPYMVLVNLARLCTRFRIGSATMVESCLQRLIPTAPDDDRAIFALGELYEATGQLTKAADEFERAAKANPNESAILSRLGLVQLNLGMPANAERSFRRALELNADDMPAAEFLSQVLSQTNRAHEVPALWKSILDRSPQAALVRAKYAGSLVQGGDEPGGRAAFEEGIAALEDPTPLKRWFAPYLAQKSEFDRAMDLYEDVIESDPDDVQVLLEYAQTLQSAGRTFEVPKVLQDVLALEIDNDTRAQTQAWLIEVEQPQRTEAVEAARQRMESGDAAGAVEELLPMRNWLGDYWKLWLVLAAALNRATRHQEAEQAALRVVQAFPGCEPIYAELATALAAQGRHDEAYTAMRMGANNVPNSLTIAINLALAAKRVGNTDEARALAQQIRNATGSNPDLEPVLAEIES